jgi:hypothetical protein
MARNRNQPGWNIKGLTDAEVSAAIHYLDWDSRGENGAGNATRGICCTLTILFLEWAAFILLYYHTR